MVSVPPKGRLGCLTSTQSRYVFIRFFAYAIPDHSSQLVGGVVGTLSDMFRPAQRPPSTKPNTPSRDKDKPARNTPLVQRANNPYQPLPEHYLCEFAIANDQREKTVDRYDKERFRLNGRIYHDGDDQVPTLRGHSELGIPDRKLWFRDSSRKIQVLTSERWDEILRVSASIKFSDSTWMCRSTRKGEVPFVYRLRHEPVNAAPLERRIGHGTARPTTMNAQDSSGVKGTASVTPRSQPFRMSQSYPSRACASTSTSAPGSCNNGSYNSGSSRDNAATGSRYGNGLPFRTRTGNSGHSTQPDGSRRHKKREYSYNDNRRR